jgi:hypothetical protein
MESKDGSIKATLPWSGTKNTTQYGTKYRSYKVCPRCGIRRQVNHTDAATVCENCMHDTWYLEQIRDKTDVG